MDDLISREEAISTIKSMLYQTALNSVEGNEKAAQLYADIADNRVETWLKLVDSVDAAPVMHGRWVYEHNDPVLLPCSVCGYQVYRYNNTHYCPECGAKMDGERRGAE